MFSEGHLPLSFHLPVVHTLFAPMWGYATAWLLGYLNRQERVHAGRAGTGVKSSLLVLMQRYLFDWSSSGNNGSPIPEQNVLSVAF